MLYVTSFIVATVTYTDNSKKRSMYPVVTVTITAESLTIDLISSCNPIITLDDNIACTNEMVETTIVVTIKSCIPILNTVDSQFFGQRSDSFVIIHKACFHKLMKACGFCQGYNKN